MLHYLNAGKRDYFSRPVFPYRRPYWEIQAVVEGRAAVIPDALMGGFSAFSASQKSVLFEGDSKKSSNRPHQTWGQPAQVWKAPPRVFQEQSLWIFPPEQLHGWMGIREETCEVVVFHFSEVPEPLSAMVRRKSTFAININQEVCKRLIDIYDELIPHYINPSITGNFYFRKALYELCILFLEAWPERPGGSQDAEDEQRVYAAIAWYNENMRPSLGVEEAAAAVHCSESHLRRLFGEVIGKSPREVFQEQQMKRAREFLRETNLTVEQIAEYCGFSSISSFSRAFKREEGVSPLEYRKR
jgi:AraC family transcriptional regulator